MRIPQTVIPFYALPQLVQALHSGRGGEINVWYICCLDGRVTKAFELWDLAEDGVCKVQSYARVEILSDFREDSFHTHFFNAQQFQIPFLGRRSVNMSVKFTDAARATQQVGSRVASWT